MNRLSTWGGGMVVGGTEGEQSKNNRTTVLFTTVSCEHTNARIQVM
jgi:hypothetical protein